MELRVLLPLGLLALAVGCCQKKASPTPAPASSSSAKTSTTASRDAAAKTHPDAKLAALDKFEGKIDLLVKDPRQKKPMPPVSLVIKGGVIRADVPPELALGGPTASTTRQYAIVDTPHRKLSVVMAGRKQVVVMDFGALVRRMKSLGAPGQHVAQPRHARKPARPGTPPKITKTGKSDTVAGYRCQEWQITTQKGRAAACVANVDVGWLDLPMTDLPQYKVWGQLLDGKHLPLRIVVDENGKERGSIEITKLEQKTIPDSVFAIPKGYKTVDLAALAKGAGLSLASSTMPNRPPGRHGPHSQERPRDHLPDPRQVTITEGLSTQLLKEREQAVRAAKAASAKHDNTSD